MCNAWNHPANCTCGWGGEGHLGDSSGNLAYASPGAGWYRDGEALCWLHSHDVARPSRCPYCARDVFFVRHNGGSVWFDELGWPWPVHACFATPGTKRAGIAAPFAIHESTNTTPHVSEALLMLVGRNRSARLGLVKRVAALGNSFRIVTVVTADGVDREVAVEAKTAPATLVGAFAVYTPSNWLVALLCNDLAIRGWWLDRPPGHWRPLRPNHEFALGDLVSHLKFGIGVVIQSIKAESDVDQKVKVVLATGLTKTFSALGAGLQWLERSRQYTKVEVLRSRNAPKKSKEKPPTRTALLFKGQGESCPYCSWLGPSRLQHLRAAHPSAPELRRNLDSE